MAKFTANKIQHLYYRNLKTARACLAKLEFCSESEPVFQGLNGWVFEQTIQDCLFKELGHLSIDIDIREQESLGGRAKADLLIGKRIAIEIKASGLFDMDAAKRYGKYRAWAKKKGYTYLYVTLHESYLPYKDSIKKWLGAQNTFFLDSESADEWQKFVNRVFTLLKHS